jgi:hypothetical protein
MVFIFYFLQRGISLVGAIRLMYSEYAPNNNNKYLMATRLTISYRKYIIKRIDLPFNIYIPLSSAQRQKYFITKIPSVSF